MPRCFVMQGTRQMSDQFWRDRKYRYTQGLMNWIDLTELDQLTTIKKTSFNKPVVLFKHSTRCGTSAMVLSRLNRSELPSVPADFYFLDLIKHRDISNQIAQDFNEYHESPQLLLIINGECTYTESHLGITMDELTEQLPTQDI